MERERIKHEPVDKRGYSKRATDADAHLQNIWIINTAYKLVLVLLKMSALMFFAHVCEIEQQVDAIYYHRRRDWERRHLRWRQDMEKIRRTGRRRAYAKPVAPSIEQIRKEVYRRF